MGTASVARRQGGGATFAVDAVSFDAHRTLFHTPRMAAIYAEVLGRHGLAAREQDLARLVPEVWQELACRVPLGSDRFSAHPGGARGFWRQLLERVAARLELPRPSAFAAAELFDRFARVESWEVYPDVVSAFAALRAAGLRLAVASNFDQRLPRLLARMGLADDLSAVVWSARVGAEKPHPAIFRQLLADLELPAERVLHVGDDRRLDVEGAEAAGMPALWLQRSGGGDLASLAELPARVSRGAVLQ